MEPIMKTQHVAGINRTIGTSLNFFFSAANPSFSLLSFAAILASQFSEANASLVINKGTPEGGDDKCQSLSHCSQSYITDGGLLVSQVFQAIVQASTKFSLGAGWQLSDCLTMDKVDTALITALLKNSSSSNITSNCASSSLQFFGYQTTTMATNLTTEQCAHFQSNYQTITTECLDSSKAYGLDAAIVFILLGALCFLGCAVLAGCRCHSSLTEEPSHHHVGMDLTSRNMQKLSA